LEFRAISRRRLLQATLVASAGVIADACTSSSRASDSRASESSRVSTASGTPKPASSATQPATPDSMTPERPSSSPASSPSPVKSSPSGPLLEPAREIVRGPASKNAVALTFHGAGDVTIATRLLSEVEAAGAHVSVLAVGQWLDEEPGIASRILDGGHDLGNHTYRHLTMPGLSAATDYSEILRCAAVLRRLTGSAGRWFRPSGTDHASATILAAAARAGYSTSISYDVDPLDYDDPGATTITERVLSRVTPGSIVSLHFGHVGTQQAVPAILQGLKSRGLAAVTLTSLLDGTTAA
jgi:peptidoglycan/xylan/chitin deacetylase (PgdA/CDA1 family)